MRRRLSSLLCSGSGFVPHLKSKQKGVLFTARHRTLKKVRLSRIFRPKIQQKVLAAPAVSPLPSPRSRAEPQTLTNTDGRRAGGRKEGRTQNGSKSNPREPETNPRGPSSGTATPGTLHTSGRWAAFVRREREKLLAALLRCAVQAWAKLSVCPLRERGRV